MCVHACVYVCVRVCVRVWMYTCLVSVHACVCVYLCMRVRARVCVGYANQYVDGVPNIIIFIGLTFGASNTESVAGVFN